MLEISGVSQGYILRNSMLYTISLNPCPHRNKAFVNMKIAKQAPPRKLKKTRMRHRAVKKQLFPDTKK